MAGNFSQEEVLLAIYVEQRVQTKMQHELYRQAGFSDDLVNLRADEEALVGPLNPALSQKG